MRVRPWLLVLCWSCATAVMLAGCGTTRRGAPRRDASGSGQLAARRSEAIRRARLRAKRLRGDSSDGSADGAGAQAAWALPSLLSPDRRESGDADAEPSVCGWASLAGPPDPDGEAADAGRSAAGPGASVRGWASLAGPPDPDSEAGDGGRHTSSGPSAPRAAERTGRQRRGGPKRQQRARVGLAPKATDSGQPEREESRYMTADIMRALKRRRRHYSTGSMMLHQSLARATNVFNLLAVLSVRMIPLELGDYREKWVDPMPFYDYQSLYRRDLMQKLVGNMEAANVAMVLRQLGSLKPSHSYTSIFAQYRQLPMLLAEVLVRLGAEDTERDLEPAALIRCWSALASLRHRPQVLAHLGSWAPRRRLYALVTRTMGLQRNSSAHGEEGGREGEAEEGEGCFGADGAEEGNEESGVAVERGGVGVMAEVGEWPAAGEDRSCGQVVAMIGYDPATLPQPSLLPPVALSADALGDEALVTKHTPAEGGGGEENAGGEIEMAPSRRRSCVHALARATRDDILFASLSDRQLAKILGHIGALYAHDPADARQGLRHRRPRALLLALRGIVWRLQEDRALSALSARELASLLSALALLFGAAASLQNAQTTLHTLNDDAQEQKLRMQPALALVASAGEWNAQDSDASSCALASDLAAWGQRDWAAVRRLIDNTCSLLASSLAPQTAARMQSRPQMVGGRGGFSHKGAGGVEREEESQGGSQTLQYTDAIQAFIALAVLQVRFGHGLHMDNG